MMINSPSLLSLSGWEVIGPAPPDTVPCCRDYSHLAGEDLQHLDPHHHVPFVPDATTMSTTLLFLVGDRCGCRRTRRTPCAYRNDLFYPSSYRHIRNTTTTWTATAVGIMMMSGLYRARIDRQKDELPFGVPDSLFTDAHDKDSTDKKKEEERQRLLSIDSLLEGCRSGVVIAWQWLVGDSSRAQTHPPPTSLERVLEERPTAAVECIKYKQDSCPVEMEVEQLNESEEGNKFANGATVGAVPTSSTACNDATTTTATVTTYNDYLLQESSTSIHHTDDDSSSHRSNPLEFSGAEGEEDEEEVAIHPTSRVPVLSSHGPLSEAANHEPTTCAASSEQKISPRDPLRHLPLSPPNFVGNIAAFPTFSFTEEDWDEVCVGMQHFTPQMGPHLSPRSASMSSAATHCWMHSSFDAAERVAQDAQDLLRDASLSCIDHTSSVPVHYRPCQQHDEFGRYKQQVNHQRQSSSRAATANDFLCVPCPLQTTLDHLSKKLTRQGRQLYSHHLSSPPPPPPLRGADCCVMHHKEGDDPTRGIMNDWSSDFDEGSSNSSSSLSSSFSSCASSFFSAHEDSIDDNGREPNNEVPHSPSSPSPLPMKPHCVVLTRHNQQLLLHNDDDDDDEKVPCRCRGGVLVLLYPIVAETWAEVESISSTIAGDFLVCSSITANASLTARTSATQLQVSREHCQRPPQEDHHHLQQQQQPLGEDACLTELCTWVGKAIAWMGRGILWVSLAPAPSLL